MTIIVWLRRDVRLHDNTALMQAVADSGGAVVPCYVLDEAILRSGRTGTARLHFLLESLRELGEALRERGGQLIVRRGEPLHELLVVARTVAAKAIYFNRDYGPFARTRDERVTKELETQGYQVKSFKDVAIWEPEEIVSNEGKPYSVYTPYAKRWWGRVSVGEHTAPLSSPERFVTAPNVQALAMALPTARELGFELTQQVQQPGERAARELLARFVDARRKAAIGDYDTQRDVPAAEGTSRLSPHLRLGTISPRTCLQAALDVYHAAKDDARRTGPRAWIGELIWRDFYMQVLYHHPHVLRGAMKRPYNALAWENDPALFDAWKAGRTGYPIVDAGMRQMNQEAWMHNRLRMITASFLCKDLLVDWRLGELYFMQQLACGCPAANNGGWQWAAGTGTDAQPFFRIFNPTTQGQKFDPDGALIRRYIPELANVPTKLIHEPWKLSQADQQRFKVQLGQDYPLPVVDHKEQRPKALAMYRLVKENPDPEATYS